MSFDPVPFIACVAVGQTLLLAWALRVRARQRRLEERLERVYTAISLLTDTTESGFQTTADELSRVARQAMSRDELSTRTARILKAARRGKPVRQIAAEERMSEGEVHLQLRLEEALFGA